MKYKNIEVFVRTAPSCKYCEDLKTLFSLKEVTYTKKDITEENHYEDFLSHKLRTVPAVFIDGEFVGGFTEVLEMLGKGESK